MYGLRVHKAVLDSRETVSGVTIHIVDEEYDHGPVVSQRQVPVLGQDTPESLGARVRVEEHALFSETIQKIANGNINLDTILIDTNE